MKRFAVLLGLWTVLIAPAAAAEEATAIFAGGCFWCMEPPYDKLDGVIRTTSGYSGGEKPNPTYKEVSSGRSGHIEVVEIVYDPAVVSYEKLLTSSGATSTRCARTRNSATWARNIAAPSFMEMKASANAPKPRKPNSKRRGGFICPSPPKFSKPLPFIPPSAIIRTTI